MSVSVREKPPLRLSHDLKTPSGKHYRWADNELDPAKVPSGVSYSDAMPGGFENGNAVLPRKPGIDYPDLGRLTEWTMYGAGGEIAWQGRLERAPRVSGSQMAISPAAVGYQAALDDDKSAAEIYGDRSQERWQGASALRRIALDTAVYGHSDPNNVDGGIELALTGNWDDKQAVEAWYGVNIPLGALVFGWYKSPWVDNTDPNWSWAGYLCADDLATVGTYDTTGSLVAAGPGSGSVTATAERKWALLQLVYSSAVTGVDGRNFSITWQPMVVGAHGVPLKGTAASFGFLASDVVAHAVRKWAPILNVTEGPNGSVRPSSFLIEHLVFPDATTVSEIIRQASRFEFPYWGVWDNREFVWDPNRTPRKRWRARRSPSQLEETGPQVERLWESVIVQFQDTDGSAKTVGPPGSGANIETTDLKDPDPENPANKLGIIRRDMLVMGTATVSSATKVGRRFLEESKLLDSSGRGIFVGYVEDDRGVLFPYWAPRSGDLVSVIDAADTSYRRLIHTEKDHQSRTCSFDLDAPPQGLQQLLERLGVALVRLGL